MSGALVVGHGPECPCTRCRGFEPGHELSVKHGAYSRRLLQGHAEQLAAEFEEASPDASAPVVSLAALTMAQLIRATIALEEAGDGADLAELKRDAHRWTARLESLCTRMGLLVDRGGALVNIQNVLAASPEWRGVQTRIVQALAPHPEALEAVLVALEEGDVSHG